MKIKEILKDNRFINQRYTDFKLRERRVSYGNENPDKTFYVVRRISDDIGLFSYVMTNLGHIKYAVDRGYVPIIDMQNYTNTYLDNEEVGKKNAWEFFFEQPMNYTLRDISRSKNIILSYGSNPIYFPGIEMVRDRGTYEYWKQVADRYLHINKNICKIVEDKKEELFGTKRVLGVLCRGTDYINNHPPQHPIQPDVEEMVRKSSIILQEEKCNMIFLATEDERIYSRFYKEFGERLITNSSKRFLDTGTSNINRMIDDDFTDKVHFGEEYLVTICLLARCDFFLAGCTGGTYGVMLLANHFNTENILYYGLYQ